MNETKKQIEDDDIVQAVGGDKELNPYSEFDGTIEGGHKEITPNK